ncbi:hypothetical protein HPB50_004375 [Hyalomma asiaticum]|uniref:Uncharacterized protein n=1 Tax=Hyalomma asiaticum TaxID=266040 RepID=A0ACB7SMA3_HYAAI|nr:hypothetical protein HPB50_004375 [Hyalomma asiaticum]
MLMTQSPTSISVLVNLWQSFDELRLQRPDKTSCNPIQALASQSQMANQTTVLYPVRTKILSVKRLPDSLLHTTGITSDIDVTASNLYGDL